MLSKVIKPWSKEVFRKGSQLVMAAEYQTLSTALTGYKRTSSTRRLSALPAGVEFDATGRVCP